MDVHRAVRPAPGLARAVRWTLLAVPFAAIGLLGTSCTRSPSSSGLGQGLVALEPELFVPPELRDHDHGEDAALHARERPGYHDFGLVPDGAVLEHAFELENSDPIPVTILAVEASCTCTVAGVSYREPESGARVQGVVTRTGEILVVPPGAVASIGVRIDTRQVAVKNTDKLITLRVSTDSVNQAFVNLECHLIVERAFTAIPERLDLGALPASVGGAGRVELVPAIPGVRITGIAELPSGVLAELVADPSIGRPRWSLEVALAPPIELGQVVRVIRLATELEGGQPGTPFEVQVVARGEEDVAARPGRLVLRGSPPSGSIELATPIVGERLALEHTEVRGELAADLTLVAEPLEPDAAGQSARWRLTLSARPELPARSFGGALLVRVSGSSVVGQIEKEIAYVHVHAE